MAKLQGVLAASKFFTPGSCSLGPYPGFEPGKLLQDVRQSPGRGKESLNVPQTTPSDLGQTKVFLDLLDLYFLIPKMKSDLDNHSGHLQPHHSN